MGRKLLLLAFVVAPALFIGASARADTMDLGFVGVSVAPNGFTWTYSVAEDAGSTVSNGTGHLQSYFSFVNDIAGLVPGSGQFSPVSPYNFAVTSLGSTVTGEYTGTNLPAISGNASTPLGTLTFVSTLSTAFSGLYTSFDLANVPGSSTYTPTSNPNLGTIVPFAGGVQLNVTAAPLPKSALGGLVLIGLAFFVRRREQKIA